MRNAFAQACSIPPEFWKLGYTLGAEPLEAEASNQRLSKPLRAF